MKAELICLNSENRKGLNLDKVSKKLALINTYTTYVSNIDFEPETIEEALLLADSRSDIVFLYGACGYNTMAKDVFCNLLRFPVQRNDFATEHMENQIINLNLSQDAYFEGALYIPEGSVVFPFKNSIFSAFAVRTSSTVFILLPDTDNCFVTDDILKYLSEIFNIHHSACRISTFDRNIEDLENLFSKISRRNPVDLRYSQKNGIITIDVIAYASSKKDANSLCNSSVDKITKQLNSDVISLNDESLAKVVVNSLGSKQLTLSCAESCTGGMITEAITDISGASKILEMGICAYSNRIKTEILKVPQQIIEDCGAVSKQTACYMAKGIKELSGSDIAVSVTGVAGPDASEYKPVGTVFIALYDGNNYWVRGLNLDPSLDRNTVRAISANTALDLIKRFALIFPINLPGASQYDNICVLKEQPKFNLSHINENPVSEISHKKPSVSAPAVETEFYGFNDEFQNGFKIELDDEYFENEETQKPKKADIQEKKVKQKKTAKPSSKKFGKLKAILFVVLSIILVGAIIMTGYFIFSQRDDNLTEKLNKIYTENDGEKAYGILKDINLDYTAWLMSKNSDISLPVCLRDDNSYYLNRNFKNKQSSDGTLFFDKKCSVNMDTLSTNLVIYGKNLNNGNMFSSLVKYESVSYLSENNVFIIDTGSHKLTYQIFAVLVVNANADDDNGYIFPFTKSSFSSEQEFNSWIAEIQQRSIFNSTMEFESSDNFLTLSTNYNAFENSRFVVMAKQVETLIACDYTVNPNPQYPQVWYDLKGLKNPFDQ